MKHGTLLIAFALSAISCGRDPGRPTSSPAPVPATAPAPEPPLPPDNALDAALDLGPWKLYAISRGISTDSVRVSVFARHGSEYRCIDSAADLAALVASWRSESDVEEFYRIVEWYCLPEPVADAHGKTDAGNPIRNETRRLKWIRAVEGGFEAERVSEAQFGKAKIRGQAYKVTLKSHSYAAEFTGRK